MSLSNLLQDLRFAPRMLGRSRMFSSIAVLVLGVVIGANTAIFSLDAVLLRPMPRIARPNELVSFERWQAGQLLGARPKRHSPSISVAAIDGGESTAEAIDDWHYWIAPGRTL